MADPIVPIPVLRKIVDDLLVRNTREYKIGLKDGIKDVYEQGYEWIACNDDTNCTAKEMEGLVSVALLADICGKSRKVLVRDICKFKRERGLK